MKNTGITRQLDKLGRIVLPMELRTMFDIESGDALEIYVEDNKIVLTKYAPSCVFCQNDTDIVDFKGKNVCKKCLTEMSN